MKRELNYDDKLVILKCKELITSLIINYLKYDSVPLEICGLSKSLYVLSNFPKVKISGFIDIGASVRGNGGLDYYSLIISEDNFELYSGGSVYNEGVGSDSFTNPFYDFLNPTGEDFELEIDSWLTNFKSLIDEGGFSVDDQAEFIDEIEQEEE